MAKAMATMVKVERRCCRVPSFVGDIVSEVVMFQERRCTAIDKVSLRSDLESYR